MYRTEKDRQEYRDWVDAKMLRPRQVRDLTGLSRVTLWRLEKKGQFPKRVQLTERCVGWRAQEIVDWLTERAEAR